MKIGELRDKLEEKRLKARKEQEAIQAALDAVLGQPVPLKFETTLGLVSGLELSAQGQKLAWSISDYLGALSSGLEERLGVAEPE